MDEEYLIFADPDGMYPGNIVRSAKPVDWSSLLQASVLRQRQQQQQKKSQLPSSSSSSLSLSNSHQPSPRIRGDDDKHEHLENGDKEDEDEDDGEDDDEDHDDNDEEDELKKLELKKSMLKSNSLQDKINLLLSQPTVDLEALKKLAWAGVPSVHRPACWKLLLGYAPKTAKRRRDTIERKRREYREAVEQHFAGGEVNTNANGSLSPGQMQHDDDVMMRQIAVDIPRTSPGQKLFQIGEVQAALQRILYVWAMRHPASGYVQGMNDLVTPFVYVFLREYATRTSNETDIMDASSMADIADSDGDGGSDALADAEADSYWCLTTLLNDIQDYYTFSQPGIQRRVHFLRDLVSRVDAQLCAHLEEQGLDFLQFAFRWMNCLLMRELPFAVIVRVWDTYLAEADGFAVFHVYVCAALLVSFSEELQQMEFQELVMFLQNLPTQNWSEKNMDIILSQAYMWRTIFGQSPSHLQ